MAEDNETNSDPELAHLLEPATSGRAKCRGCGARIDKGALRFGEQVENPYNDGVSTLWFHTTCAAYKRPEPFLSALPAASAGHGADLAVERAIAERTRAKRRLQRLDRLERAASGRATCRHCKKPIDKDAWRIRLVWFEAGRFEPSGFVHVACAPAFCESDVLVAHLRHFSPDLPEPDWAEARALLPEGTS